MILNIRDNSTGVTKNIDSFPQTLKGLCIILVVFIHLPWGQDGDWTAWLWISIRKIINFAVATFFFLSAYYTKPYEILRGKGVIQYYRKRLKRLLVPYLFWSIIYILVIPVVTTGNISERWFYYAMTGKGPLYFLLVLVQFTFINPILQQYKNNMYFNIIFWMVTPLSLFFYYSYNFSHSSEFKPELFLCFPWFACYYLGLKLQEEDFFLKIQKLSLLLLFSTWIALLIISMVESYFIYEYSNLFSFSISQITVGSILCSLTMIIIFMKIWSNASDSNEIILISLGNFSMGIFLMHPLYIWIYKFLAFHSFSEIIRFYALDYGYITINLLILFLSLISSYMTSKYLSERFPFLIKNLGLR